MVCKQSSKKENPDGNMIFKICLKYKLPCGLLEIHPGSDSDVKFYLVPTFFLGKKLLYMLLMKEPMCLVQKKKQHNIGFPTFKLSKSTKNIL